MEIPLLREILIIFSLSIAVLLVCYRLRIPTVVGFLLTGVLSGPHGLGLVSIVDDVQMLASIGIVLLLFSVGMEFSLKKILQYKNHFLIGGTLQVLFTVIAGFCIARFLQRPFGESIFLGFLLSLSSTAIVMRVLEKSGQSNSPHGNLILGILIFQDIIAIPMMLMIPILAGTQNALSLSSVGIFFEGLIVLAIVVFCAIKLVPKLLYQAAKAQSRELFLLSVLTICFSVAWMTSSVGLSLSLGAFLAGLVISESEYSNEAISDIIPFQDVFTSFFFISMGMLLDLSFVVVQPLTILAMTVGILLLKSSIAGGVALILGLPLRTAILTGIALSQVGEFSFVLAKSGIAQGIATDYHYQLFLAISLLTMATTPLLIELSPLVADWFVRLPFPEKILSGFVVPPTRTSCKLKDHIVIVGFGLGGRNLALAAKDANIPYFILEMNPETVKIEKEKGEPIHFGDATHHSVLSHASIKNARALSIIISDPAAAIRIVKEARKLNPQLYIISRTRYMKELEELYKAGANDVMPDEFGASVEILTRVMYQCLVPADHVEKFVSALRLEGVKRILFLGYQSKTLAALKINFADSVLETIKAEPGSAFVGKTLAESDLKIKYGLTVLLIKRKEQLLSFLFAETRIEANDLLVVIGPLEQLKKVKALCKTC